jgi:hypothetical protein
LGSGFGVSVQGFRSTRLDKEGKRVEKHVVMDWGIFALAAEDIPITNAFLDTDENCLFYCFAEDSTSGNSFEFRLNNTLEFLNNYKKQKNYNDVMSLESRITKANVAMLMSYGTVLLPVDKDAEGCRRQRMEEQMQRELLARARMGDLEAEYNLDLMAKEQEIELAERLSREDLLSVFEGYFLNMIEKSGIFSILADILKVEELTNEASGQKLYRLTISITDTKTTVYISQSDLIGLPTVGMRLMGIGLLQGAVNFSPSFS